MARIARCRRTRRKTRLATALLGCRRSGGDDSGDLSRVRYRASAGRPAIRTGTSVGTCRCCARAGSGANGSDRPDHCGSAERALPAAFSRKFRALSWLWRPRASSCEASFIQASAEMEWCDRRLLARIHRLTINKLRAEIQPVSIAEYQRFLVAWQRVDAEHRAFGVDGARSCAGVAGRV